MSRLITVFDRRTGKRTAIPEHWLGIRLGAGYTLTDPNAPAATSAPPASPRTRGSRPSRVADDTTATTDPVVAPEAPAAGDTEQESDPRC
jgi:hypothetical protein